MYVYHYKVIRVLKLNDDCSILAHGISSGRGSYFEVGGGALNFEI